MSLNWKNGFIREDVNWIGLEVIRVKLQIDARIWTN